MANVVSPTKHDGTQQTRGKFNRENNRQAVSPEQIWDLLTLAQQQRVMQVLSQAGRILAQDETKERCHESR